MCINGKTSDTVLWLLDHQTFLVRISLDLRLEEYDRIELEYLLLPSCLLRRHL